MSRTLLASFCVSMLLLGSLAIAGESSPAGGASPAIAPTSTPAPQAAPKTVTCGDKVINVEAELKSYFDGLVAEAVGDLATCPAIQACTGSWFECIGNNGCGANLTTIDLGWKACDTLSCPEGQTVHVDAGVCGYCPCCNAQPYSCLCPGPSIGCGQRAVAAVYCQ
jgi:hypothetical protein